MRIQDGDIYEAAADCTIAGVGYLSEGTRLRVVHVSCRQEMVTFSGPARASGDDQRPLHRLDFGIVARFLRKARIDGHECIWRWSAPRGGTGDGRRWDWELIRLECGKLRLMGRPPGGGEWRQFTAADHVLRQIEKLLR